MFPWLLEVTDRFPCALYSLALRDRLTTPPITATPLFNNATTFDWSAARRFEFPPITSLVCGRSEAVRLQNREERRAHIHAHRRTVTDRPLRGFWLTCSDLKTVTTFVFLFYSLNSNFFFVRHWIKEYSGVITGWNLGDLLKTAWTWHRGRAPARSSLDYRTLCWIYHYETCW